MIRVKGHTRKGGAIRIKPYSRSKPKERGKVAPKKTYREFIKGKMGPYMKKYGGHGPAIRQIAKEWKEYKAGR